MSIGSDASDMSVMSDFSSDPDTVTDTRRAVYKTDTGTCQLSLIGNEGTIKPNWQCGHTAGESQ